MNKIYLAYMTRFTTAHCAYSTNGLLCESARIGQFST